MQHALYVAYCGRAQAVLTSCKGSKRAYARYRVRQIATRGLENRIRRDDQCAVTKVLSSGALSISQDVADVIPAAFDLDCELQNSPDGLDVLKIEKLFSAGNTLSKIWSKSGASAARSLRSLPLASRQPTFATLASNQLTLQCGNFCQQLVDVQHLLRPGHNHMDLYVMLNLCLKVDDVHTYQLVVSLLSCKPLFCSFAAALGSWC